MCGDRLPVLGFRAQVQQSDVGGDGIGIELFEFPNTEPETNEFQYWRPGLFHFCLQDEQLEERVKRIEDLPQILQDAMNTDAFSLYREPPPENDTRPMMDQNETYRNSLARSGE